MSRRWQGDEPTTNTPHTTRHYADTDQPHSFENLHSQPICPCAHTIHEHTRRIIGFAVDHLKYSRLLTRLHCRWQRGMPLGYRLSWVGEAVLVESTTNATPMRCDVASSEFTQLLVCLPSLHRSNPLGWRGYCRVYMPWHMAMQCIYLHVVYIHISNNMYVSNSDAISMHLHTRGELPHAAAVWV